MRETINTTINREIVRFRSWVVYKNTTYTDADDWSGGTIGIPYWALHKTCNSEGVWIRADYCNCGTRIPKELVALVRLMTL